MVYIFYVPRMDAVKVAVVDFYPATVTDFSLDKPYTAPVPGGQRVDVTPFGTSSDVLSLVIAWVDSVRGSR